MPITELVCISCPLGCPLRVETDGAGRVIAVTGNTCKRGEDYGRREATAPMRTVTSTVGVTGGTAPVAAVRTRGEVPKNKIFAVMEALRGGIVPAPVELGQVIIPHIAGTDADLIATQRVERREAQEENQFAE